LAMMLRWRLCALPTTRHGRDGERMSLTQNLKRGAKPEMTAGDSL
jgi:hypothetical protein